VDEARALMKLKWNRYINQQERTTPLKKLKIPDFYTKFSSVVRVVGDSIKTPFLVPARPKSTASIPCYPPWLALRHHLGSQYGLMIAKAGSYREPERAERCTFRFGRLKQE